MSGDIRCHIIWISERIEREKDEHEGLLNDEKRKIKGDLTGLCSLSDILSSKTNSGNEGGRM